MLLDCRVEPLLLFSFLLLLLFKGEEGEAPGGRGCPLTRRPQSPRRGAAPLPASDHPPPTVHSSFPFPAHPPTSPLLSTFTSSFTFSMAPTNSTGEDPKRKVRDRRVKVSSPSLFTPTVITIERRSTEKEASGEHPRTDSNARVEQCLGHSPSLRPSHDSSSETLEDRDSSSSPVSPSLFLPREGN